MTVNVMMSQLRAFVVPPSCVYVAGLPPIHSAAQQKICQYTAACRHRQSSAATDPLPIITRTVKLSSAKSVSQYTTSDTTVAISDSSRQYCRYRRVLLAKR